MKEKIILQKVEKVLATLHLEPELHSEVISYIKASAKIEQGFQKMRVVYLTLLDKKVRLVAQSVT